MKHFVVADRGLEESVPIDEPFAAVDFSVAKQAEKRLADRAGALVVEREAEPLPVATATELFELAKDPLFVLLLPLPDALDKAFAAQVVAIVTNSGSPCLHLASFTTG